MGKFPKRELKIIILTTSNWRIISYLKLNSSPSFKFDNRSVNVRTSCA